MSTSTIPSIGPETTMATLLQQLPGARRSLFSHFHIGGCSQCAFNMEETLAEVCARYGDLPVEDVIAKLEDSHQQDEKTFIEPPDLKAALESPTPPILIDIRTREEFEAVHIANARFFNNSLQEEIFAKWQLETFIVLYDHTGDRVLDTASWFIGHGMHHTRALRGGIDAYSQLADPSIPRYRIEAE